MFPSYLYTSCLRYDSVLRVFLFNTGGIVSHLAVHFIWEYFGNEWKKLYIFSLAVDVILLSLALIINDTIPTNGTFPSVLHYKSA